MPKRDGHDHLIRTAEPRTPKRRAAAQTQDPVLFEEAGEPAGRSGAPFLLVQLWPVPRVYTAHGGPPDGFGLAGFGTDADMVIVSSLGVSSIFAKRTLIRLAESEFHNPERMEEKRFEQTGSMERS